MAASTPMVGQTARRKTSSLVRHDRNWGLIFLSPWIVGFLLFFVGPMVASLYLSFTNYDLNSSTGPQFIGLANWGAMIADPEVHQSLLVTLRFLFIAVPLQMGLALGLAVLLNAKHLMGVRVFRTLFYMPQLLPFVAGTIIWGGVLNTQSGWINKMLESVGIQGPGWTIDATWVIPALSLMGIWGVGNTMLVMLAGLQGVPTELYEAAQIDGAGPIYSFFRITIPMISPVLFYNLVLALIGAFQYFLPAYVLFGGTAGPDDAARFYLFTLFKQAWVFYHMGYASTLAWGLFIVALAITVVLFATAKQWVYYAGGDA